MYGIRSKGQQVTKPALGAVPDLNTLEREQRLNAPYLPMHSSNALFSSFEKITAGINRVRSQFNAPPLKFNEDDVRLINELHWNWSVLRIREDENIDGAFNDPLTGKIYLKYNPELEDSNESAIILQYTMAHELAHNATPKLPEQYSFHLCEGIVDWVAKEVVFSTVLSGDDHQESRAKFIKVNAPKLDGMVLMPDEVLVSFSEKSAKGFSRIPQMRLLQKLRDANSEIVFSELMRLAFIGDIDRLKLLIGQKYPKSLTQVLESQVKSNDDQLLIDLVKD